MERNEEENGVKKETQKKKEKKGRIYRGTRVARERIYTGGE